MAQIERGDRPVGVPDYEVVHVLFHESEQVCFSRFRVDVLWRLVQAVTFGQCFGDEAFEKREKALASLTSE
jgi:hypothetical protein